MFWQPSVEQLDVIRDHYALALIGVIPMTLAVILAAIFGVETCKRRLEETTADELKGGGLGSAARP